MQFRRAVPVIVFNAIFVVLFGPAAFALAGKGPPAVGLVFPCVFFALGVAAVATIVLGDLFRAFRDRRRRA